MGLLQLLSDVLPAFVAVGKFFACSDEQAAAALRHDLDGKLPMNFCLNFYAEVFNLHAIVSNWEWAQQPDERKLCKILDELESRFLSILHLVDDLGWTISNEHGQFLRLKALQDKLSLMQPHESKDIELEDEELEDDQEQEYLNILLNSVQISKSEVDRKRLLKRLRAGYIYLEDLSHNFTESPTSPVKISEYPSKHVRRFASSLHKALQRHWSCTCPDTTPHGSRKTQFSLTTHRRFETIPNSISSQEEKVYTEAKFDILFPTTSDSLEWQESEIHVFSRQAFSSSLIGSRQLTSGLSSSSFRTFNDIARDPVRENICDLIRDAQNFRLKMQVDENKLWRLRKLDTKRIHGIQQSRFLSLGELIKRNKRGVGANFSTLEGRDRLILSYILAVSLLHLYEGPWLQKNWSNQTICFLINAQRQGRPNFTKPLLTASCTKLISTSATTNQLHVHSYPSILALGIMLLEISLGTTMDLEREGKEKQDDGNVNCKSDFLVALRLFDDWIEQSKRNISNAIPQGLKTAIEACLYPSKIPYTKPPPKEDQVLQYILTDIVAPLGTALSDTYEISIEKLHEELSKEKQADDAFLFDCYDGLHTFDQRRTATTWFDQDLQGVHHLIEESDRPQNEHKDVGRVKVAVLDTGFEPPEGLMESYEQANRIKESKSWITSGEDEEVNSENWRKDLDGHGTHVAYLLLRVAPIADVHIAQVFETRKDLKDPEMAGTVHQRVASAINHATNAWKVDIIILSFGFEEPVSIIYEAIKSASNIEDKSRSSTLIFAATRNDGANKLVAWPARINEVIGISSTDGNGQHSIFNPHDDGSNTIFYALGEAVEVACPSHVRKPRNKTRVSGTSFANPIAAGLAANVLGYAKLAVRNMDAANEREALVNIPDRLKYKDGMKAVFKHRMTMMNSSDKPCLLPWKFLKRGRPGENCILYEILETLNTR